MPKTLEARLKNFSIETKEWVNKYIESRRDYHMKKDGFVNEVSLEQYKSNVVRFIESAGKQNIKSFTMDDIDVFVSKYKNLKTKSKEANYLKSFFVFLSEHIELQIDIQAMSSYISNKKELEESGSRKGIPISIDDLITLRSLLRRGEHYDLWLTFELIYQFGFKYEELVNVTNDTFDFFNKKFKHKKYNHLFINDLIYELISLDALPKKKYSTSTFDYRIKKISRIMERNLNRDLIWKDIKQTREKYFFRCPICDCLYENDPRNWVVYEYEEDNSKWIVCRINCASGDMNE